MFLVSNAPKPLVQKNKIDPKNKILSTTNSGQAQLYKTPSQIFCSKLFNYRSANSDEFHYAFLMWPKEALNCVRFNNTQNNSQKLLKSGKFPVIHSVYAGPSIQLVKDNWHGLVYFLII